jgi:mercuric ion transport protein
MLSKENEARAKKLTLGGAVVAAIAASSCCIGPLILAALGIGGAGAFATIAAYRPYILAATAALLAGGFYLTYRKPKVAAGDACGCESPMPKANRAARVGLWIATALVVVFAAAPPLLAAVSQARPVPVAAGQKVGQTVISVQGLDCEACAAPIRTALTKVGGFHDLKLDLKAQTVAVTYEPAPGRLQAYVAAINGLGYEASAPSTAKAAAP